MADEKLKDGLYKLLNSGQVVGLIYVEGNEVLFENEGFGVRKGDQRSRTEVSYGAFDFADKRGLTGTGKSAYAESGNSLILHTGEQMEFLDEEAIKKLEDDYEKSDNYTHYYPLHPENQGMIVIITGGMAFGKSTTAEVLRKEHGFILYEGDCFQYAANPYARMSPEGPSFWRTKNLKNKKQDFREAQKLLRETFKKLIGEGIQSPLEDFKIYELMCDDILKEKEKIGGNWVIPTTVYQRNVRDMMREKLGKQCIFVVLEIENELMVRRMAIRSLGKDYSDEALQEKMAEMKNKNWTKGYERFREDEENTIAINVTESMTPTNVVDIILQKIELHK